MCESGGAVFFVKSRLYDDSFETEKTCSVHLTLEASSPHLVARQPLGRVEEDFSASGFFPMWLFFWGFVFLYLQCTFVTSDLCIVLSHYEKRKKKTHDRRCPVKGFNLDFIFVPK